MSRPPYPRALAEVEAADAVTLMRWVRFLPSPRDDHEVELMNRLYERWGQLPADDRVAASKAVGL